MLLPLDIYIEKKYLDIYLMSYIKVNFRCTEDVNVKGKQ